MYHPLLAILPWLPFLLSDLIMWGYSQGSVLDPPVFLSIFNSLVISSSLMSMNAIYRPMIPKLICPVQIFLLQILISICLLGVYTWMPNCLLKLNLFKTEFLFPWVLVAKPVTVIALLILVNSNPLFHYLSPKISIRLFFLSHSILKSQENPESCWRYLLFFLNWSIFTIL